MFKTIEECKVELITFSMPYNSSSVSSAFPSMDAFPARAARVSFSNDLDEHTEEQNIKLIHYLADHQHLTPFEYQHATLMIECPLFIRSQIHRHRTFSYNEISRRYTSDDLDFWIPTELHQQAVKNKQGATEQIIQHNMAGLDLMKTIVADAEDAYFQLLDMGVAREQARAILPQNLLTRFYMGGNLRNWAHFLQLRLDSHAQHEVQVVAKKCHDILHGLWPTSLEALMKK